MGEIAKREFKKGKYFYSKAVLLVFCDVYKGTKSLNMFVWGDREILWESVDEYKPSWILNNEDNLVKDIMRSK